MRRKSSGYLTGKYPTQKKQASNAETVRKFLGLRGEKVKEFTEAARAAGLSDVSARRMLAAIRLNTDRVLSGELTPAAALEANGEIARRAAS